MSYDVEGANFDWIALEVVTTSYGPGADSDGTSDTDECESDIDPFDSGELLRITNFTRAALSAGLQWPHSPRRIYQVKSSPDLMTWTDEGAPTLLDAASVATGGATRLFLKVEASLP